MHDTAVELTPRNRAAQLTTYNTAVDLCIPLKRYYTGLYTYLVCTVAQAAAVPLASPRRLHGWSPGRCTNLAKIEFYR